MYEYILFIAAHAHTLTHTQTHMDNSHVCSGVQLQTSLLHFNVTQINNKYFIINMKI